MPLPKRNKTDAELDLNLFCAASDISIEAADKGEDGKPKLRRFKMVAYTGVEMNLWGWPHPVVVDLAGMIAGKKSRPILKDHDVSQIVGHTDSIDLDRKLVVEGVISGVGLAAQEVVGASDNGFPWQASIGARVKKMEFVEEGKKIVANGREFVGPIYVAKKSTLGEVSFVALGADDATSGKIAATLTWEGEADMTEEEKKAKEEAEAKLKAEADKKAKIEADKVIEAEAKIDVNKSIEELRAARATEMERIVAVEKATAGHPEIAAKAVKEGWTVDKAELEALRAERPKSPAIHMATHDHGTQVLECALMSSGGAQEDYLLKRFGDKTMQSAHSEFRGRLGLQRLILEMAWANGYTGRFFEDSCHREILRAAFSTDDIDGILSNTANKFLLDGFEAGETVWQRIAGSRNVSDFKQITSYRMLDDFQFIEVGKSGELQHGNLAEESFTNQAKTYGIMHAITRTDQINDDLSALTDVPRRIGMGANEKVNDVFWTAFFAITFTGGNASTGAFAVAGLTAAELKFLLKTYTVTVQSKSVTKKLLLQPRILLVPPALKTAAEVLLGSANLLATGSTDAVVAQKNPHAGKWTPETSRYMQDASYGNSALKYCLLTDPAQLAILRMAWLNGVQSPTIESADADFNTLGIQVRGYLDFGVGEADVRAGVMSTGA